MSTRTRQTTKKTTSKASPRTTARERRLATDVGRDAVRVLFEAYCNRRLNTDDAAAHRGRKGAKEYGAALDAIEPHVSREVFQQLDDAHGAALAAVKEQTFAAGVRVGLGLVTGGAR